MKLEQEFQLQAIANALAAQEQGFPTKRLAMQLQTRGGAETVRELCRSGRLSDGFSQLCAAGRGELTLEALAVKGRFSPLFTDEEANHCLALLMEAGYF